MYDAAPALLDRLTVHAAGGRWGIVAACLGNPLLRLFDEPSRDRFHDRLDGLENALNAMPELQNLLELRLAGDILLYGPEMPAWALSWLSQSGLLERWLPGVSVEAERQGRWTAVPVLLAGEAGQQAVRYLVVGCVDNEIPHLMPEWADRLLDSAGKGAVRRAADLSGKAPPGTAWYCFPLAAPMAEEVRWYGSSLGLPLGIGWRLLASGESYPQRVAATGTLDDDGGLEVVAGLASKHRAARWQGFVHLVYPAGNRRPKAVGGPVLHPAADLDGALIAACLAGTDQEGSTRRFARMMKEPDAFAASCREMPPQWLGWARRTGRLAGLAERIGSDPERLNNLARQLERLSDAGRFEAAEAVAGMLLPDALSRVPGELIRSAFRWSLASLVLANRRGRVAEADAWSRTAADLLQRAGAYHSPKALAARLNATLVHEGQGRYRFDPRLADNLESIVSALEERFDIDRRLGCRANASLGALCGTMAQHYGFCGPPCIDQTEAYVEKARKVFGGGREAEFSDDWRRPLNYRCYARLDAGDAAGALAAMLDYLDAPGLDDVLERSAALDRWQHALIARYLADWGPPDAVERYLDLAGVAVDPVPIEHPWQLWAVNMGRLAEAREDLETADGYYRAGLTRCLEGGMGPTGRVMALLPMARLTAIGTLDSATAQKGDEAVREAAGHLNAAHFRAVFEMDFEALLAMVRRSPQTLFPFAYR